MRGAAAGLMNTVGWGGGALGPIFVGVATQYGHKSTEVENMSDAIAVGGAIYFVATVSLLAAIYFASQSQPVMLTSVRRERQI
jgi:hypothetical protein